MSFEARNALMLARKIADKKAADLKAVQKAGGGKTEAKPQDRNANLAAFLKGNHPDVPHVVYHGTRYGNIDKFKGWRKVAGHFAFTPEKALDYADEEWHNKGAVPYEDEYFHQEGPQIYPVHLSAKNVFDARNPEHVKKLHNYKNIPFDMNWNYVDLEHHSDAIRKAGFDSYFDFEHGIHANDPPDGIAVFHPHQIKSATGNQGTFDPKNPDITKAEGGGVERKKNKIGLFSKAAEQARQLPSGSAPAAQLLGTLRNKGGIKAEELHHAGITDESGQNYTPEWQSKGKITPEELASHFESHVPDIEETVLRDDIPFDLEKKKSWIDSNAAQSAVDSGDIDNIRDWENADKTIRDWHLDIAEKQFDENLINDDFFKEKFAAKGKNPTKYGAYTLPGGENYREVLLKLPKNAGPENKEFLVTGLFPSTFTSREEAENYIQSLTQLHEQHPELDVNRFPINIVEQRMASKQEPKENFFSSHWDDPNILAHIRMSDRRGPNGEKILHVEEVQSDWGQKGKKEGFVGLTRTKADAQKDLDALVDKLRERVGRYGLDEDDWKYNPDIAIPFDNLIAEKKKLPDKVTTPSAPYVTSTPGWTDLALKRILKEAAEGGYDKIVWTPGEEQAARYDLSNHVDRLVLHERDGQGHLIGYKDGESVITKPLQNIEKELPELVGKDVAQKLMEQEPYTSKMHPGNRRELMGADLSLGGEGMKGYYDSILPKRLQALAQKHDKTAKVGYTDVMLPPSDNRGSNNPPMQAPGLTVTPQMRDNILSGQEAYARGGDVEREEFRTGGSPDLDVVRQALSQVADPLSQDPELAKKAVEIASKAYKVPTGNITSGSSYYGHQGPMDISDIQTTVEPLPNVNPLQKKNISWEDFYKIGKGGTMINLGGDRSRLGRLTHINNKKLAWPVDLHAGPEYMLEPNPEAVWANAAGHTTGLKKKILQASDRGPVYGVYTPMGPKTVDSSFQMFDALLSQIAADPPSKKAAQQFDTAMKNGLYVMGKTEKVQKERAKEIEKMENWPGILNTLEAREHAKRLPGSTRSLIVKYLDRSAWNKLGFPHVGVTRAAITNPDLLSAPANMMGHRIVELSPKEIEETAFKHNTYASPTAGKYVGDVPLVQRQYAMPDVTENFLSRRVGQNQDVIMHPYSLQSSGRDAARKMFEEQKQSQIVGQKMLDSIQTGLEKQKHYGLARGGDVMHTRKVPKPHTPVVGEKPHKPYHPAMMIPGIHVVGAIHGIPYFTGKK